MLKAVYTVEASIIISLCFIMFGAAVGISYQVYQETVVAVTFKDDEYDAVKNFRKMNEIKQLFGLDDKATKVEEKNGN